MKSIIRHILIQSPPRQKRVTDEAGVSLAELLAVIVITGVLAAIAAPSISIGRRPLQDTTNRISGNFRMIRSKAISQTSAYRIRYTATSESVTIERATDCTQADSEWSRDPGFIDDDLKFEKEVDIKSVDLDTRSFTNSDWTLCFDSRGRADQVLELTLEDDHGDEEKIEIFRGGLVSNTVEST